MPKIAMLRTVMSLAVTAMLIHVAMAANHTVGGANGGWDTSTNVQSWPSSQSFSVGDNLVFQYQPNHDVVEVSKADYDSCQASNPIQTYNGGNTVIPLSSAGKRYFICGTPGHCSQGMKVEIDTLATSAATPTRPAATPTPTPPPPPASSPAAPVPSPSPKRSALPPTKSVAAPVPSPSPKSSALPPTKSLASAPAASPLSPKNSPSSSPDVPSTESSANSPSPNGSAPSPGLSSANKADALVGSAAGFGLTMVMMLLAQSF